MPARVLVVCFMVVDDLVVVKAKESVAVDMRPDRLPRFPWKFGDLDCFRCWVAPSLAAGIRRSSSACPQAMPCGRTLLARGNLTRVAAMGASPSPPAPQPLRGRFRPCQRAAGTTQAIASFSCLLLFLPFSSSCARRTSGRPLAPRHPKAASVASAWTPALHSRSRGCAPTSRWSQTVPSLAVCLLPISCLSSPGKRTFSSTPPSAPWVTDPGYSSSALGPDHFADLPRPHVHS